MRWRGRRGCLGRGGRRVKRGAIGRDMSRTLRLVDIARCLDSWYDKI
jgi:hypothetical protein